MTPESSISELRVLLRKTKKLLLVLGGAQTVERWLLKDFPARREDCWGETKTEKFRQNRSFQAQRFYGLNSLSTPSAFVEPPKVLWAIAQQNFSWSQGSSLLDPTIFLLYLILWWPRHYVLQRPSRFSLLQVVDHPHTTPCQIFVGTTQLLPIWRSRVLQHSKATIFWAFRRAPWCFWEPICVETSCCCPPKVKSSRDDNIKKMCRTAVFYRKLCKNKNARI